jgi:hypothetical protein
MIKIMENFTRFTEEEDDILRTQFSKRVSRLAIKLNRPYWMVEQRCVILGLMREKQTNDKYYIPDEEDYNLLKEGCDEQELKALRGRKSVFSIGLRNSTNMI